MEMFLDEVQIAWIVNASRVKATSEDMSAESLGGIASLEEEAGVCQ